MDATNRRTIVLLGATSLAATALGCAGRGEARDAHDERSSNEEEVSPGEDLMREHGVLNRILLVYEESIRRLETPGRPVPLEALTASTGIVRRFIEDYHEKLEEDFLFPRFEKRRKSSSSSWRRCGGSTRQGVASPPTYSG